VFRDLLPRFEVGLLRGDALAALGYVANWRMIYRGDDYFAQTAGPVGPASTPGRSASRKQFYVLWPLLVVVLVALAGRRARPVLVALCLAAAAASAVAAALLFDRFDVNRSYFGTDNPGPGAADRGRAGGGAAVAAATDGALLPRSRPTRSGHPDAAGGGAERPRRHRHGRAWVGCGRTPTAPTVGSTGAGSRPAASRWRRCWRRWCCVRGAF
jgi:hypothetical protein